VRWALAIKSAISNKGTTGRVQEKESKEVNWQRFDVSFQTKAPLLLNVKGVANRNDLQQVGGFSPARTGFLGPCGRAPRSQAKGLARRIQRRLIFSSLVSTPGNEPLDRRDGLREEQERGEGPCRDFGQNQANGHRRCACRV
jgi:hypothetical protein